MTSPPVSRVSERDASVHRLVTPTVRVCTAAIILMTGAGISAVFWKMPSGHETHDLYHAEMIDKNLAATPLPSESIAMLSPEEREQMTLPELDIAPATDDGSKKYAQVYPLPAALAARNAASSLTDAEFVEEEPAFLPDVPQKLEPMRPIVEEKPLDVEPVSREFQARPNRVTTVEKSDEMLSKFHFAGNSRANFDELAEPESPVDPFPAAPAVAIPALQPLQPIELGSLSPLLPLRESELLPLSKLIPQ